MGVRGHRSQCRRAIAEDYEDAEDPEGGEDPEDPEDPEGPEGPEDAEDPEGGEGYEGANLAEVADQSPLISVRLGGVGGSPPMCFSGRNRGQAPVVIGKSRENMDTPQ